VSVYKPRSMYKSPPQGWTVIAEHTNDRGERIGIAKIENDSTSPLLLLIWDDPPPEGTGICAPTLLDDGAIEWLRSQLTEETS